MTPGAVQPLSGLKSLARVHKAPGGQAKHSGRARGTSLETPAQNPPTRAPRTPVLRSGIGPRLIKSARSGSVSGVMSDIRVAATWADAQIAGELLHSFNEEFQTPSPGVAAFADRFARLLEVGTGFLVLLPPRGTLRSGWPSSPCARRASSTAWPSFSRSCTSYPSGAARASAARCSSGRSRRRGRAASSSSRSVSTRVTSTRGASMNVTASPRKRRRVPASGCCTTSRSSGRPSRSHTTSWCRFSAPRNVVTVAGSASGEALAGRRRERYRRPRHRRGAGGGLGDLDERQSAAR